ncbi:MAG: Hsp20/alpha crystallin family protein [Pseudomonadota bacterium]
MSRVRISFGDLHELHQKMCRMVDEVFSKPSLAPRGWRPAVDIFEEADGVVLLAELAGVDPEAIEVTLDGSIVRIAGSRKAAIAGAPVSYYQLEIDHGQFERIFRLPVAVDGRAASAVLSDGYLRVHLPKLRVQARSVAVESS